MSSTLKDEALAADWPAICRRIVEGQRKLFESQPTIADRELYEGTVGEGGDRTLVIDRQCEDIVFGELERLAESRGAAFTAISEERGAVQFNGGGETWVVIDPIDGSLNVRRTIPQHSLSLAVATAPNMGAVQFGYVYDFGAGHEFLAHAGQGAELNGVPIRAQTREPMEIVGIESAEPGAMTPVLERLVGRVYRMRCLGSLALTVCFVAAGRFDGMLSPQPSRSVDVAAAQLIAREAGALVELGEDGLTEAGLDLDQRFPVTAAGTAEGLRILLEATNPR
ncbi:MAG: hypothetical protein M9938_00280 [Solirubrobacterales bacterium]|nr:hypothetical protein [Solirubrobacterales bacterium]